MRTLLRGKNNATETTMAANSSAVLATTVINNTYSICGKRIASVPTELMELDYSYQRVLGSTVKALMEDWDDNNCDFLEVSYRDNKFYIIDGQHRYTVARAKGITSLPCIIFTGLTREQEALRFARQQDNVNKLTPYDTFKANVACGDMSIPSVKIDMEIKRICDLHNIRVVKSNTPNKCNKILRCLSEARRIVSATTNYNGVECFEWIINIINATNWACSSDSYKAGVLTALKNHYLNNDVKETEPTIVKVLNSISPRDFVVNAKFEYPDYTESMAIGLYFDQVIRENR